MPPGTSWRPGQGEPTATLLLRHGQTPMSVQKRYAGRSDAPLTEVGVQPGAVPVDPGADLLDVAFGPALLSGQVTELGLGHDDLVLELAGPGLQAGELGDFGQAAPAVVETGEPGVQVGQFEQAELTLR